MLKKANPTSAGVRHKVKSSVAYTASKPQKSLTSILKKNSGRNARGIVTMRHQGGRHKRLYRVIDFRRDKRDIPGVVVSIEYDPNRTANIALINYPDGEKRYIIAPLNLKVGATVVAGASVPLEPGNALPLKKIPVGMPIHNIELTHGKGGQIVRGAGGAATIQSKEGDFVAVKLPSGEIRLIKALGFATIGQVSNVEKKNIKLGKAGRSRHMGIRPTVRGVAQNPRSHPHGGGEGRSGIGMPSPKSPWGKHTLGKKTRKGKKYSDKYIVKRRGQK